MNKRIVTFVGTGLAIGGLLVAGQFLVPNNQPLGAPTIESKLAGKTAKEKANLKGQEIAKLGSIAKTKKGDYSIEVVSLNPIDNGVEVFARAWDKNDNQIGFGKDGTVEIERFKIINPPVLVPDVNGNIIRSRVDDVGETHTWKLREDLKEALLQSLQHTISVKKERHGKASIIAGKIGHTTLTVYPDAGSGATSVDGFVGRNGVDETFATIRAGAGTVNNPSNEFLNVNVIGSATNDQYSSLARSIMTFDTSSLTADATISSATLSIYGRTRIDTSSNNPTMDIYASTPAADNNLENADYGQVGTVSQTGSPLTYASYATEVYNDFTFNATGRGNIDKTGVSTFGVRNENYDVAGVAPTWNTSTVYNTTGYTADTAGTTKDPKLVVEYTTPVTETPRQEDPIFFNLVAPIRKIASL